MTDFDNVTINDTLTMKMTDQYFTRIKNHIFTFPAPPTPILRIDQGVLAFRDLSSLGFLASVSKTEIPFSSTYTNCDPADIGKQVRDDGVTIPIIVLAGYDNVAKKWWLSGSTSVASGSAMTIVNGTGAGTSSGASSVYGGGAIKIGHGLTGATDPPKISLMDSAQGYDTLYLKKFDGTPAHLDLGNLIAHGTISVDSIYAITQGFVGLVPILPLNGGYANGNWANPWGYLTAETVYCKYGPYDYGCAKELSNTPMERKFKTVQEATARLEHEVTKEWLHLAYGEKDGTIKCICGKELTEPCPEHRDEWMDRYTVNKGDVIDATALIVLNLMERIEKLETIGS